MKKVLTFSVLMVFLACMVGCSPNLKNTEINATAPASLPIGDKTFEEPVLLKDIMYFNFKDAQSITIIKYENNEQTATVRVKNKKKIAEITNALFDFSVVHVAAEEDPPQYPTVYEIHISPTNGPEEFLSITSRSNENEFNVGGDFIEYMILSPLQPLLQSNAEISFGDIQKILEPFLEK